MVAPPDNHIHTRKRLDCRIFDFSNISLNKTALREIAPQRFSGPSIQFYLTNSIETCGNQATRETTTPSKQVEKCRH